MLICSVNNDDARDITGQAQRHKDKHVHFLMSLCQSVTSHEFKEDELCFPEIILSATQTKLSDKVVTVAVYSPSFLLKDWMHPFIFFFTFFALQVVASSEIQSQTQPVFLPP